LTKTIVLTGASDGIGAAAAAVLAQRGHRLILVGRSIDKTGQVAEAVGAETWFTADYERLEDVRRLAGFVMTVCPRIDVLANNAGGIFSGPTRTEDGFERTFQVNHLASFLLTHELMEVLLASGGTVVNTSSIAARLYGHIDIDDLNDWQGFSPTKAYGDSKLANILFTRGLQQRYGDQGLSAVAFHPGNIATNFASDTATRFHRVYHSPLKVFLTSAAKGGRNLAHFIDGSPGETWVAGEYYGSNRRIGRTNPQASDPDLIREHWERSSQMLGLT
jgi:NAD(P)-dependent dehydrogenase (short-subunit alcohol dehydrogenase family)